ncbi:MAG: glycosyltransferase family 2 protein [Candidatus Altiarchaeota archaeon]|nr:glycosyltransferase family 2 protein [Candidatus Altiarchaeota archaeon]
MIFLWLLTGIAIINLVTALMAFKKRKVAPLKEHPDITIICRTWDDDHVVGRFIDGCLNQDYRGKIQIILADDASQDATSEVVKKYKGKIEYIRAVKHHKWKALFLNKIIKTRVKGEILINTDIDAVLPRNYVTEMVRSLQNCDAVSSTCIGGNPDTIISKVRIIEDLWFFATSMVGRAVITRRSAIYGGSHAIWMKVLKAINYYGTKTMTEDAELAVILHQKGYKTCFSDRTVVLLEDVVSLSHFLNERKRWLYGLFSVSKYYRVFQPYNLLAGFNSILSGVALISAALITVTPLFVIPFGLSLVTLLLSLFREKAKPYVYSWIPIYILLDPILECMALLGIIIDSTLGKGVKWIKVSGSKYHVGSHLISVFKR